MTVPCADKTVRIPYNTINYTLGKKANLLPSVRHIISSMEEKSEQDWIKQAGRGEPAAIAELFGRYWRAFRATAYGVTGDLTLAEDAAAEAFYAAVENLDKLKHTQRFGPWLHTIVVRTARRHKAAKPKTSAAELEHLVVEPDARLEQQELALLTHEAVAGLSATLREAISLFYFEGYSIKEAAHFLDVPEGTLKRRLHEGRQRLRSVAERILEGTKPMNEKREQILLQLSEAANEGIHSETFFQIARQALRLRPVPNELMKEIMRKHLAAKRAKTSFPPEKKRFIRDKVSRIYGPSERMLDPNHSVGAVANAIRAALPEFQQWQIDWSAIDFSTMLRGFSEGDERALSFLSPPDFTEGTIGSYISAMRVLLLQDEDGSLCTPYELMQKKDTMEAMRKQIRRGKRLSDTLQLLWKDSEPMELRTVEKLLLDLSQTIVPETPVRFVAYEDPRYRAAVRMHTGDNTIPAAIGGALNSSAGLPDGFSAASVVLFLEPWAAAQSGQIIELKDFPPTF